MKKVLALVFAAVLAFSTMCLVACGGSGIDGTYTLTGIIGDQKGMEADGLKVNGTVTISGDTATYKAPEPDITTMTWSVDSKAKKISFNNNEWDYTLDGNKLTMTRGENSTKVSMELTKK